MEFVKNATYKKAPQVKDHALWQEFEWQLKMFDDWTGDPTGPYRRQSLLVIGRHGLGKTAFVKDYFSSQGVRVVEKSLAQCEPSNFFVPVPQKEGENYVLDMMLLDELKPKFEGEKVVLFLDEVNRVSHRGVLNMVMEVTQEFTMAGIDLPHLVGVVCAANPPEDDYMGLSQMDMAQADRFSTVFVDENSTPWRYALALKYKDIDLKPFFTAWEKFDAQIRHNIPPRVLDFFISLSVAGAPQNWVLPVISERQKLVNSAGEDKTNEILGKLASALELPYRESVENPMEFAINLALSQGWNLRILGDPGIGKTSRTKRAVEQAGFQSVYKSLAQISPEDLVVPVPKNGNLVFHMMKELTTDKPKVLILDELSRADKRTASAAMELTGQGSLAGTPIPGLVCSIALDNRPTAGGVKLDTGRIDRAQATRFVMTLIVEADDTGWRNYLQETYGELADHFCDWRAEDLDDTGRVFATPRLLERLIQREEAKLPLRNGIPVLGKERIPLENQLYHLEQRLKDRKIGLSDVIARKAEFLEILTTEDATSQRRVHIQNQIVQAFTTADPKTLKKNLEPIAELFVELPKNEKFGIIRGCQGDRQRFWVDLATYVKANSTDEDDN